MSEITTASSNKTKIEIFQTLRLLFGKTEFASLDQCLVCLSVCLSHSPSPVLHIDLDNKYISKCLALGLLETLCLSMDEGVYDVSTNGGHCLCCIALECAQSDASAVLSQVADRW